MVKTTVTTSFGDLTLPVKSDDQRILAEVKGLTLLQTIVEQSKIWASIYSHERGEFEIFSLDDGEELSIYPLETIRKFHIHDNPHLEVTLDDEPVCILMEQGQQCAAVDAVISLVLLGEAGWPLQQTPFQLRHKAKHLAEFRIRTGSRFQVMITRIFFELKSSSTPNVTPMPSQPWVHFQGDVMPAKGGI